MVAMESCLHPYNSRITAEFDFEPNIASQTSNGMLTKKEKILIQPFIEQNYKKHRSKVKQLSNNRRKIAD